MAFSFSQPQQSLFQTPSQAQQSLFQTPTQPSQQPFQFQQTTPNPFQQQQQQLQFQQLQQQQQQQQQQSQFQPQQTLQQQQLQQIVVFTVDKVPASYNTKWADLHPDSQKFLQQIEERILEYRDESQRLDQCSRLYDSSVSNDGFELDASYIIQELGGISTAMEREKILVHEQMAAVKKMLRDTEIAVRSFMILRQRFLHANVGASPLTAGSASQTMGASVTSNPPSQPMTNSIPVFDFYNGVPRRPSPFMQHTVSRFEKYLAECSQWIDELEQLVRLDSDGTVSSSGMTSLQSLPIIMSNVHDYFVHVTSKVESLHQCIESMKMAYLADQRRRGDWSDPFLEADRRETAKQEAAARRVHPTLHLPAIPSQPSTQVAGLITSSVMPGSSSSVPQLSSGASPASSFPMFSNITSSVFSAPMSSSSLFSTPSSSAPTSALFSSSGSLPQTTPFGPSPSLFGSAQTSSLFGLSTPPAASLGFGNSPAFSTPPFASGAPTGSGASFSGASKSSKPKSRIGRR